MNKITYKQKGRESWVSVNGVLVGYIRPVTGGFQYFTKNNSKKGGLISPTLDECKLRLENGDQ